MLYGAVEDVGCGEKRVFVDVKAGVMVSGGKLAADEAVGRFAAARLYALHVPGGVFRAARAVVFGLNMVEMG